MTNMLLPDTKSSTAENTDFGFATIPRAAKTDRVKAVFSSVAARYDLMNDLMSGGLHRLWKRTAIELLAPASGQKILDLAGGSGDMTALLMPYIAPDGSVTLADINADMLAVARTRLLDQGYISNIAFCEADAEHLPFADAIFDSVIIAFGLRNITDRAQAFAEMLRVLKSGGTVLILEFSPPSDDRFGRLYDWYSFHILPQIGKHIANDAASYRYLVESIRRFPDQQQICRMMRKCGFSSCHYRDLSHGIVTIYQGSKI